MSEETAEFLHKNVRVGFTDRRGSAWWFDSSLDLADVPSHYAGAVPFGEVEKLFGWEPVVLPHTYVFHGDLRTSDRIDVVRGDNGDLLGQFTEGYQPHSYKEWLLRNVSTLLDSELSIGSAGLLKNGAQAWVQVEFPESLQCAEGVTVRPWLMATTSLDGSIKTTYKPGYTDVVCDNTRAAFLREKGEAFGVKHTRNSTNGLKIMEARDALGIVYKMSDDISAEVEKLTHQKVTDDQWSAFVAEYFAPGTDSKSAKTQSERKKGEIQKLWTESPMVAPWQGSAWGVLQAVNTWTLHQQSMKKGQSRMARNYSMAITGDIDKSDIEARQLLYKTLATV